MPGPGRPKIPRRDALAALFGITENDVAKLVANRIIPPARADGHDVPAAVSAYIAHLKAEARKAQEAYNNNDLKFVCNVEEAALVMGITAAGVRKLARESGMPRDARGAYDLRKCVPWYLQMWKKKAQGDDISDLAEERRLMLKEQRMMAEIERRTMEGTKIDRDEAREGWAMLAGMFVAALDALVAQVSPVIVHVESPAEARAILKGAANSIREELANELDRIESGLPGVSGDDPSPLPRPNP
jgi:hypothetical protein